MSKIIKEIIIMLLVCLITMLVLAIGLYQYSPNRKVVPEVTTYVATEDIQDLLEDNIDSQTNDDVILTYEVTSNDLKNYQNTNNYVPGKSNPFAATQKTTTEGETYQNETNQETESTSQEENTTATTDTNTQKTQNSDSGQSLNTSSYFKETGTK